jgi:membrane dipeptidase
MIKNNLLLAAVVILCCGASAQMPAPTTPTIPSRTAKPAAKTASTAAHGPSTQNYKAVHNTAIVVDTHADTPMRFLDDQFDPSSDAGTHHWDIAKAKSGNLGVEFFSIWVEPGKYKDHYTRRALDMIDSVNQVVEHNPNDLVMAFNTRNIYAARKGPKKRIAVLMGVEGGHAIENDVRVLRDFYRLGVRYMTLTWANSTEWAQSSGDLPKADANGKVADPGLTDAGRSIVREMNRLGMMVDISHVSDRSFYNALTVSRAPVIASHSSSRTVTDVPRNLTDDMLIALARNGGVAQVNFNCGFISAAYNKRSDEYGNTHPEEVKRYRELWKEYAQQQSAVTFTQVQELGAEMEKGIGRPALSELIDHFDHMIKVAGVDHVGIGSDFDGVECLPQGIDSVADLPKITEALMQRGYTAADMQKILGGNLLRVFADVERVSREIQTEKNPDRREEVSLPRTEKPK